MDIEVVVSTLPGPGEGRKFDIFGPTESFAVYTSRSPGIVLLNEHGLTPVPQVQKRSATLGCKQSEAQKRLCS